MSQNPFNQAENLQSWLEKDTEFQKAKKQSFANFARKNNLKPNFIMNTKEFYLKTVNLITKNVVIATILMSLVVGGATVTAAEILLPRYKPSSLLQNWFENKIETPVSSDKNAAPFANNTQSQKDPNQLLVTDDQNDVLVNYTCGLIVKYPKKFENSIVKSITQGAESAQYSDQGDNFYIFALALDNSFGGNGVSMKCSNQKPAKDPFEVKVSKEKLQEITGWFLSAADIQDVTLIENENIPLGYSYYFKYKDLYYSGEFVEKAVGTKEQREYESLGGLYATQVQIQFTGQVPNPPKKPTNLQQSAINENNSGTEKNITTFKSDSPTPKDASNFNIKYTDPNNPYKTCNYYSQGAMYVSKTGNLALNVIDQSSVVDQEYYDKYDLGGVERYGVPTKDQAEKQIQDLKKFIDSKTEFKNLNLVTGVFTQCDSNPISGITDLNQIKSISELDSSRVFLAKPLDEFPGNFIVIILATKGKYLLKYEVPLDIDLQKRASDCGYKDGYSAMDLTPDCYREPTEDDLIKANLAAEQLLKTFKLR